LHSDALALVMIETVSRQGVEPAVGTRCRALQQTGLRLAAECLNKDACASIAHGLLLAIVARDPWRAGNPPSGAGCRAVQRSSLQVAAECPNRRHPE
jgi:hypothetical protein